ncbi:uncharacterized protein LOC107224075 isoform X2 [Neodiprion lecontei]|uniref:Uncharacterized protein LOC107224075 isoform X2 n=1 Tax=Neodiprion lecontei TaxID=441921 RepID=A0ABM3G9B1_NEOLC|nr:uncharacterized protein LOC107224075 isoform X2 [Neodiprion lecontei]
MEVVGRKSSSGLRPTDRHLLCTEHDCPYRNEIGKETYLRVTKWATWFHLLYTLKPWRLENSASSDGDGEADLAFFKTKHGISDRIEALQEVWIYRTKTCDDITTEIK